MKYLPTIDLWADGVQDLILSGRATLQRGQWCRCGASGKRCRFVSISKQGINVVHWQGSSSATATLFNRRVTLLNNRKK
jgi:hypothetical protein